MSLNFVKAEWIATRKKWANLPPWVKHATMNEFCVLTSMQGAILPTPGISIQEILNCSLPRTCTTMKSHPVTFFSCKAPDQISESLVAWLWWLPTPTASVVSKPVEHHSQAWLHGYQFIRYVHLCNAVVTYFLLWLISLWETLLICRQTFISLGSGPGTGYVLKQHPTNLRRDGNLQMNVKHFGCSSLG